MSNSRTVKTTVVWHLEQDEYEDEVFQILLKDALTRGIWDYNQKQFFANCLRLVPKKEEKEDEKEVDDDLNIDDLDFDLDDEFGASARSRPKVPVGQPADSANSGSVRPPGSGVPYSTVSERPALIATEAWIKANSESNMAGILAGISYPGCSPDNSTTKPDLPDSGQPGTATEGKPKLSHRWPFAPNI